MDLDWEQSLASSGITGLVVCIAFVLYKLCKHSRCRSSCCGVRSSLSVDLKNSYLTPLNSEKSTLLLLTEQRDTCVDIDK